MDAFWTIQTAGKSEVVEKKSRFLGEVHHAENETEAEALIAAAKKRYYDARHHCAAYLVGEAGSAQEVVKASDDGEPAGSAGRPMLDLLCGRKLHQTLAIVTRYFGGTLLGTGGLVHAYSQAVKEALDAAVLIERVYGERLQLRASYADAGKLTHLYAECGLSEIEKEYTESVLLSVPVPQGEVERIIALTVERTDGRAVLENRSAVVFDRPVSPP